MPVMEKYLTVEEVAQELRVSPDTVHRLLKRKDDKKLTGYKVSGVWRILREDLDRYMEAQRNTNQQPE